MTLWYHKLGFSSNPFSIKPAAYDSELVAYDMDFIYDKIKDGEMVFIEGKYGTGKTTMLKNIIQTFQGKNRIIYYSFNTGDEFNPEQLIRGANSILRRISGLQTKNMIMLLDEVHTMKASEAMEVLNYYKDGTLLSVLFVTHDYDATKLPEEVESYLDGNVLRTVNLTYKEALELLDARIGDIDLFPKKVVKKIFRLSGRNPRRFLEYVEDVARFAVEMDDMTVTDFHIREVLSDVIDKKDKKKTKPDTKKEKPEKIEIKAEKKINIRPKPKNGKAVQSKSNKRKYKINRLVGANQDPLGKIVEKEPEEGPDGIPEYQIYYLDE